MMIKYIHRFEQILVTYSSYLHGLLTSGQTSVPNYWETLFEFPDLTLINSEPTYDYLQFFFNQIKVNTSYIHTTLGGGQHGQLGLVLTAQQYAFISPHPYLNPPCLPPIAKLAYQLPHILQTEQARHNEQV